MPDGDDEWRDLIAGLDAKIDQLTSEVKGLRELLEASPPPAVEPNAGPGSEETAAPAQSEGLALASEAVYEFVRAAMIEDDDACWARLSELTHSDELSAPRSVDHLKAFSWKKLRVNAKRYYGQGASLEVAWTEPERVDDSTQRVKVFLAHGEGSASPITVARDANADGQWRVQRCSL